MICKLTKTNNLNTFRLFFVLCILTLITTPLQAQSDKQDSNKILAGKEAFIKKALTPDPDTLPEENRLESITIDNCVIHLQFENKQKLKTGITISLSDQTPPLSYCVTLQPLALCTNIAENKSLLKSYAEWLKKHNNLQKLKNSIWGEGSRKNFNSRYWIILLITLVFLFIFLLLKNNLGRLRNLSRFERLFEILLVSAIFIILSFIICNLFSAQNFYPQCFSVCFTAISISCFWGLITIKKPQINSRIVHMLFAFALFFAIYYPILNSWPEAGFAIERLDLARGSWLGAIGGDGRHPFIFTWLLKLSDIVFPQPLALHIVSFIASLLAVIIFALYLRTINKNTYLNFSILIMLVVSIAFIKYATETSSFALWFLASISVFILFEKNKLKTALLVFAVSLYIEYVALLFIPYVVYTYFKKSGESPPLWLWISLALPIHLAINGVITDFGVAQSTATLDNVGIVWVGLNFTDSLIKGLSYLGYGQLDLFVIGLLILALYFSFIQYRKEKDVSGFFIIAPVLMLAILGSVARIRAEYFSVFFPLIFIFTATRAVQFFSANIFYKIICGILALHASILFVTQNDLLLPKEIPAIFEATKHANKNTNIWVTDESVKRLIRYYSKVSGKGQSQKQLNIKKVFSWDDNNRENSNQLANKAISDWKNQHGSYSVVLQSKLNLPENMLEHLHRQCKISFFRQPYIVYDCN